MRWEAMKRTSSRKKKRKKQVARTPVEVSIYKERFLAWLAKGKSPGTAARLTNIARCTAYSWKKADPEFDTLWDDAVETGLDELESRVFARGMKDSVSDAQFALKYRRYERRGSRHPSDFILNITLQEQIKRLERLGLPVPILEGDYEVIEDAPGSTETDRS